MHLQAFFATLRRWFGCERALARCPVSMRRPAGLIVMLLGTLAAAPAALASVSAKDDVTPKDDPFTIGVNDGLPTDGNAIIPFELPNQQTYWEGRHSDGGDGVPGTNDDTNILIPLIVVGQSSTGQLIIDGESILNQENMIIGDSGVRGGRTYQGIGTVRITGSGSRFNNDPSIIPTGVPSNFQSKVQRPANGADGQGNDVYVGRNGIGTLEISAGGRAEIQDALIVGANPGSIGNVIVDGFDSVLTSGGFDSGVISTGIVHSMVVGMQGRGTMSITNGATVVSSVKGQSNQITVAASIGSFPFRFGVTQLDASDGGKVTINGAASKWVVNGTLQVGGFVDQSDGLLTDTDFEGDNVIYNTLQGQAVMQVQNGSLVSIHNALETPINGNINLFLAIGHAGRVEMDGGTITIGDVNNQNQESRGDNNQVVNDGIITGSGRIETGVFRNRYLGRVELYAGQSLVVNASSNFSANSTDSPPLLNFGVVQVLGNQESKSMIEFQRPPAIPGNPASSQPFQNLRITRPAGAPVTDFYGGLISGQWSIMHFRSGLQNSGMMAFTAGTNYVTGNVVNMPAPASAPTDPGILVVSGPNTKVTFEEDLINAGTMSVTGGATVEVLARHSFVTAGDLRITLNPQNSNQIFSAGDAGIAGKLSISLSGFTPGSLEVGDVFQIITVAGNLGGVDFSDPLYPKVDLNSAPLFTQLSLPSLVGLGLPATAHFIPIYTANSVLLSVQTISPSVVGPDFNGDGMIDNLDLQIWLANVGITSGATGLQGDADGDGDVDGDDFLFWQRNVGKTPPWSGAGAGSGLAGGSNSPALIPEPTTAMLVFAASLMMLPIRRRAAK